MSTSGYYCTKDYQVLVIEEVFFLICPYFCQEKQEKGEKKKRNQEFIREQKNRNAFLAFPFQEEKKQVKQEEYKNEGGGRSLKTTKIWTKNIR